MEAASGIEPLYRALQARCSPRELPGQGHIISGRGAGREQLGIDWAVKMGTQRSRLAEYVVRPNSAPYDVAFARFDLVAVLECRPAIGSPGQLEDSGCALDALDPEALAELTSP